MRSFAALCAVLMLSSMLFAASALARPCGTMAALRAHRAGVSPLAAAQDRPPAGFSVDSSSLPLRVHYDVEGLADRAALVLSHLEGAWVAQVEEQGFPAALPDIGEGGDERLDVYLTVLPPPAVALTIANGDVDDSDGRRAGYAHIRIDPTISDDLLGPFIAHELQHVLQFGIDLDASLMFFEASAVLQERYAFPDGDTWFENFPDFQSLPNLPIFADGIAWAAQTGDASLYEYGASLFLMYLEQVHGDDDGTLVRRLWTGSSQGDDVGENEPDWLDALDSELNTSIQDLVVDFATWRSLLSTRAVDGDGLADSGRLPAATKLRAAALIGDALRGAPLLISLDQRPAQLGCYPFEVEAPRLSEIPLDVSVTLVGEDPGELALTYVLADLDAQTAERVVVPGRGRDVGVELEVPPAHVATFSACLLGEADADDEIVQRDVEVRVSRTDIPAPDAGPGPDPEDAGTSDGGDEQPPPVCGCQQVGRGGGIMGALFILGVLGFLLKARRVAARKRLKKKYDQDRAAS
jgi:hypothetical protein